MFTLLLGFVRTRVDVYSERVSVREQDFKVAINAATNGLYFETVGALKLKQVMLMRSKAAR